MIKKQRTAIGNLLITELQLEGARERALVNHLLQRFTQSE